MGCAEDDGDEHRPAVETPGRGHGDDVRPARRSIEVLLGHEGITSLHPFQSELRDLAAKSPAHDVLLEAPTGSGKTVAFLLVAFDDLARTGAPVGPPAIVVITPTRELAQQADRVIRPLARGLDRRVALLQGGVAFDPQLRNLARGADVVVATPGRLRDMVERGQVDLGGVGTVVIDEADRLADLGFADDVIEILAFVPPGARTLLVSATLDGPVRTLVRTLRSNPITLRVRGEPGQAPEGLGRGSAETPHFRVEITRERLRADLGRLLDAADRSLVFVRTRHAADRWGAWIGEDGRDAVVLHGALTTAARRAAIDAIRLGDAAVLVATDLASRGLDIAALSLVVHLERSDDEADYVHRSGRTGRAGLPGVVVNLLRKEQLRAASAMEQRLGVVAVDASIDTAVDRLDAVDVVLRHRARRPSWSPPLGRPTM